MMKELHILAFAMLCHFSYGQLLIDTSTETPEQLALTVFQGPGVVLTNVKFNDSAANATVLSDQVGHFTNGGTTNIGLEDGIILTTGKATVAIGPNNLGSASNITSNPVEGDPDLAELSGAVIRNKACLEFDFVPSSQLLSFDFVFASEEYPEFANSTWNDAVGFFLSGPGITGPYLNNAKNIALILPTTTPISINNLNNGSANAGPCEYCQFYVNNGTGATPLINSTIQYDGFTEVMSAKAQLIPGEIYHLKLSIANAGDNNYDSALFFKKNGLGELATAEIRAAQNVWMSYPAAEQLQVQVGMNRMMDSVMLYDLLGKNVNVTPSVRSDNVLIDISSLCSGIYTAKITMDDHSAVWKKIIVR